MRWQSGIHNEGTAKTIESAFKHLIPSAQAIDVGLGSFVAA